MKMIYVVSATGKALGLACPLGGDEVWHMSITEEMAKKGTPVEVPDNDFFRGKIAEKNMLREVSQKDAKPKADSHKKDFKARQTKAKKKKAEVEATAQIIGKDVTEMVDRKLKQAMSKPAAEEKVESPNLEEAT